MSDSPCHTPFIETLPAGPEHDLAALKEDVAVLAELVSILCADRLGATYLHYAHTTDPDIARERREEKQSWAESKHMAHAIARRLA